MEKAYFVYKHTSPSGKVYIGITLQCPLKRWGNGKNYNGNKFFKNAIEKYGWENFEHEILFSGLTEEKAKEIEKNLILEYKSYDSNFGYNITMGGESGNGLKHTEETKKKISNAEKGRVSPMKGKKHSEETRRKISMSNKGKVRRSGFTLSEETKMKISKAEKGKPKPKPKSAEYKEKMRAVRLGKPFSEKRKKKHLEGVLNYQKNRTDTVIFQTTIDGKIINRWQSQAEASRNLGIPQTTIGLHVRNGKPYKGFFYKKDI